MVCRRSTACAKRGLGSLVAIALLARACRKVGSSCSLEVTIGDKGSEMEGVAATRARESLQGHHPVAS